MKKFSLSIIIVILLRIMTSTSSFKHEEANTQNNEKNPEAYPNTRASGKNVLWNAKKKEKNKTAIHNTKEKTAICKRFSILGSKAKYKDAYPILDKNIDEINSEEKLIQNHSSKYTGVSRKKDHTKWHPTLTHNQRTYDIGYFDNEEHAAMKMNLLCDKCGIERQNLKISVEIDEIQQVIHCKWEDKTTLTLLSKDRVNTPKNEKNTETYSHTRASEEKKLWHAEMKVENKNAIKRKRAEIHKKNKKKFLTFLKNNRGAGTDSEEIMSEEKDSTAAAESLIDEQHILKKTDAIKKVTTAKSHIPMHTNQRKSGMPTSKWKKKMLIWNILHKKTANRAIDNKFTALASERKYLHAFSLLGQNAEQINSKEKFVQNTTSKYTGVSWNKNRKKWRAQLTYNKNYCGRYFDNEEHAAMSINLLCDKYEIERKNKTINIQSDAVQQVRNQTSNYTGVSWITHANKWQAALTHDKKRYYGGLFDDEKDAATKVNQLCDKLGIVRKNPMNTINLNETLQVQNQTSENTKVSCATKDTKLKAKKSHDKEKYYGNLFDNNKAAMKRKKILEHVNIGNEDEERLKIQLRRNQYKKLFIDKQNAVKEADTNTIIPTKPQKNDRDIFKAKNDKSSYSDSEDPDASGSETSVGQCAWEVASDDANKVVKKRRTEIHKKNKQKNVFTSLKNNSGAEIDDELFMSEEEGDFTTEFLVGEENILKKTDANERIATVKLEKPDFTDLLEIVDPHMMEEQKQNFDRLQLQKIKKKTVKKLKRKRIQVQEEEDTEFVIDQQNTLKEADIDANKNIATIQNQTLQYIGVTWNQKSKKWKATLTHNYKRYHGGYFDNEEQAAMKVNLLCDTLGIKRKNLKINVEMDKIQQVQNQTSKYNGVCWKKDVKKWQATLTYNHKLYHGGYFDNEEEAAMKVNLLCDKFGMERKNLKIHVGLDAMQQVQNEISEDTRVSCATKDKTLKAKQSHNKEKYYGELFDNKKDAAIKTEFTPGIYVVTNQKGVESTVDVSIYSPVVKFYPPNTILDLIKIYNVVSEERVRCQIKNSLDWISIQNTNSGHMFMKSTTLLPGVEKKTSKYTGVSWHKNTKKWKAQLSHDDKKYYGGLFENEEDAAMQVNLLCEKWKIKRKNPTINIRKHPTVYIETDVIQKVRNQTSNYTGVSWITAANKWQATLTHEYKKYYGGLFDDEKDAATKVDQLCDKLGIECKNSRNTIILNETLQVPSQTSQYIGVCWHKDKKKWRAQLAHNNKKYHSGYFDNEEKAAMRVNLLCDEFGIERKNPMIITKPNAIQQVLNQISESTEVSCATKDKKLEAEHSHNKDKYYGELFDNKKDTAIKIQNQTSKDTEVPCVTKNEKLEAEQPHNKEKYYGDFLTMKKMLESRFTIENQNSLEYHGTNEHNKSEAQFINEIMKYYGGVFDNEENAAMTVNCNDKCQIECTNPTIDTELIEDYQKTKGKIYQSTAENICNEIEVKAENFLKSNDEERSDDAIKCKKKQHKQDSITLTLLHQKEVEFLGEIKK